MTFKGIAFLLCSICIAIFVLQSIIPGFTDTISLEQQYWLQVWRFVTAIFAHGSLSHLLYNLFALALFGSILETLIGIRKFLLIFFVTGIIANIAAVLIYPSSLGASGAIFGIIGTLVVLRPGMAVFAFGLPMPLVIASVFWVVGDIIGLFVPSNVGNVAHLAGLAAGLLAGTFFRSSEKRQTSRARVVLDENSIQIWEDQYLR